MLLRFIVANQSLLKELLASRQRERESITAFGSRILQVYDEAVLHAAALGRVKPHPPTALRLWEGLNPPSKEPFDQWAILLLRQAADAVDDQVTAVNLAQLDAGFGRG